VRCRDPHGVREGTHFTVDLFQNLRGRAKAAMDAALKTDLRSSMVE
jgi:hypothetical protein